MTRRLSSPRPSSDLWRFSSRRAAWRLGTPITALIAFALLGGCSPTPSSSPGTTEGAARGPLVGCLGIQPDECRFVVDRLTALLPEGRGAPIALYIFMPGCQNIDPCPQSLRVRDGSATVEFGDGGEPIAFFVDGPAETLDLAEARQPWAGPMQPVSPRVNGVGPFAFELGHCGLLWKVDFDGSFWVPIGQIDIDASPILNSDSGQIRLLGPNLAEYRNATGFSAELARFPGPKHVFLCD